MSKHKPWAKPWPSNSKRKPALTGWRPCKLRLLVTRPEPQASAWVEGLRKLGVPAQALPLIAITAPANPEAVAQIWQHIANKAVLMFVSPAAVDWFFKLRPDQAKWPAHTLAAAPGPGTAQCLIKAGATAGLTPQQLISPPEHAEQFDSEALWPCLADRNWMGQTACIISGGDQQEAKGRTWLTQQWQAQGAKVETVLTYQRTTGQWTTAQQAIARQAFDQPDAHTWLFSSSQAIDHLLSCHLPALARQTAVDWSQIQALVTHPKIAERARQLGITRINQTRPTVEAVAQARRSAK